MHTAVFWGCDDTIRALADAGADLNAKDESGETPLHRAANGRRIDTFLMLAELGADPRIWNDDCETPLNLAEEYAEDSGNAEMARALSELRRS